MKGTPKTMVDAIQNGIDEYRGTWDLNPDTHAETIKVHVDDYLSQIISQFMLSGDPIVVATAETIWQKIKRGLK